MFRWVILGFLIFANVVIGLQLLEPKQLVTISFLDVGQGDAIYIRAANGNDILIDGGAGPSVLRELAKETSFFDREIDVVVATHPDKDHIGGLVDVFKRYDISFYLDPGIANSTNAYTRLEELTQHMPKHTARTGMRIVLDSETYLTVLYPDSIRYEDINDSSVVLRLTHGEVDVLLTGDAGVRVEQLLTNTFGQALESEILKVGHHGSKTSTLASFIAAVNPSAAVISAGKDNRYGHPHEQVLKTLKNIPVLETAAAGTISFVSDGEVFWLR